MISRDLAQLEVVQAYNATNFHSCTVSGFTSACGVADTGGALPFSQAGYIVDRLGLTRGHQSVLLGWSAAGSRQSSAGTCTGDYVGVALGLQHSSSTCSGGFTDYSTGYWQTERPLVWVTTATSTAASPFFTNEQALLALVGPPVAATVLSTAASTTTSTGYIVSVSGSNTVMPLDGCKRFIRMLMAPHIETTGCGGTNATIGGYFIFGDAEEEPPAQQVGGRGGQTGSGLALQPDVLIRGRVHVTSACST